MWEIRKRWSGCQTTPLPSCNPSPYQPVLLPWTAKSYRFNFQLAPSPLTIQPWLCLPAVKVLIMRRCCICLTPRGSPQAATCFFSFFLSVSSSLPLSLPTLILPSVEPLKAHEICLDESNHRERGPFILSSFPDPFHDIRKFPLWSSRPNSVWLLWLYLQHSCIPLMHSLLILSICVTSRGRLNIFIFLSFPHPTAYWRGVGGGLVSRELELNWLAVVQAMT